MKIRSTQLTPLKAAKITAAGATGAVGTSSLTKVADTVILQSAQALPKTAGAISNRSVQQLAKLGQAGSGWIAASTGLITGIGLASGAIFGENELSLEGKPLWKRLVFSGPTATFNQGIQLREELSSAKSESSFRQGAEAGWKAGAKIGGAVGSVQGGITGGLVGLEYSGTALAQVTGLLEGASLPNPLVSLLPLVVGAGCVVGGQMIGSLTGRVVGHVAGGSVGGLAGGLYAAS